MYVITLKLTDGTNYYCGLVPYAGQKVPEWDTDKAYAKVYESRREAREAQSYLRRFKASYKCKVKLAEPFSKN